MSIETLRQSIDQIDLNIAECLNQRAELAAQIGQLKKSQCNKTVHCPIREEYILHYVANLTSPPLTQAAMTSIFKCIIEHCRAIQEQAGDHTQ